MMFRRAAAVVVFLLLAATLLVWRAGFNPARRALLDEEKKIAAEKIVQFKKMEIGSIDRRREGMKAMVSLANATAVEKFGAGWFVGATGGLIEYDSRLNPKAVYTCLNGLTGNHVTALETFRGALFIGFDGGGLMRLRRGRLTRYEFRDIAAMNVTSLSADGGALYVGTFGAGVLEFDGRAFTRVVPAGKPKGFSNVTSLFASGGRLVVGSHDGGVFIRGAHGFRRVTAADGLPDDHILKVRPRGDSIVVATPAGAAVIGPDGRAAVERRAPASVTDAASVGGAVYYGTFDEGVVASGGRSAVPLVVASRVNAVENAGIPWALTEDGTYVLKKDGWKRLETPRGAESPPDNHITSLAVDRGGRVWIGSFEDGVGIVESDGGVTRVRDEVCREINHIHAGSDGSVLVATNQGLIVFSGGASGRRVLTESDGLIGNAVMNVADDGGKKVVSTASGLTIIDGRAMRSWYAFHGLVSNRVYASAVWRDAVYLGTLGGISVLESGRIERGYTAADSGLPHNWVTAMAAGGGRLFIGTYGGGVASLDGTGKIKPLPGLGGFEVNFNALHYAEPRLYIGTLKDGLKVYNVKRRAVEKLDVPLGSRNVTAILTVGERLYIGTTAGVTIVEKPRANGAE